MHICFPTYWLSLRCWQLSEHSSVPVSWWQVHWLLRETLLHGFSCCMFCWIPWCAGTLAVLHTCPLTVLTHEQLKQQKLVWIFGVLIAPLHSCRVALQAQGWEKASSVELKQSTISLPSSACKAVSGLLSAVFKRTAFSNCKHTHPGSANE